MMNTPALPVALLCGLLLTVPRVASAEEARRRLAVLEFRAAKLAPEVLLQLSDEVRAAALEVVKHSDLDVFTRENMDSMLRDMGREGCAAETECEVELARSLGADFVVSGEVIQVERVWRVSLKLHEVKNGRLLGVETAKADSELTLLEGVRFAGGHLLGTGLNLSLSGGSEMTFGEGSRVVVPRIEVKGETGFSNVNITAERLFEAAMDSEESAAAEPETKAAGWCRLADIKDGNPYAARATEACQSWRQYVQQLRTLEVNVVRDYEKLRAYLELRRKTREQHLAAIDAFLGIYQQSLSANPAVSRALAARKELRGGNRATVALPSLAAATAGETDERALRRRAALMRGEQALRLTNGLETPVVATLSSPDPLGGEPTVLATAEVQPGRSAELKGPPGAAKLELSGAMPYLRYSFDVPIGVADLEVKYQDSKLLLWLGMVSIVAGAPTLALGLALGCGEGQSTIGCAIPIGLGVALLVTGFTMFFYDLFRDRYTVALDGRTLTRLP